VIVEWLTAILLVAGSIFMFLAAVGTVRFPDLFTRMHAATKATSLGGLLMLAAVAVYFATAWVIVQSVLIVAFIFFTTPIASHMIGRAAYFLDIPKWEGTFIDQCLGRYDRETHELHSVPCEPDSSTDPSSPHTT
jgi:multicomponent Na+:H+ antiporter subunit G